MSSSALAPTLEGLLEKKLELEQELAQLERQIFDLVKIHLLSQGRSCHPSLVSSHLLNPAGRNLHHTVKKPLNQHQLLNYLLSSFLSSGIRSHLKCQL
jgi:hypothetical protein